LKLLIKQKDKQADSQKSLVEIEVQTQNIFDVGITKKNILFILNTSNILIIIIIIH